MVSFKGDYTYISILTLLPVQNVPVGTFSAYVPVGTTSRFPEPNPTDGAAPVRDPGLSIVTPCRGRVQRAGAGGASNLLIGKSRRVLKYLHKHFACELSGLRILVRRMIRGQ